MDLIHQSAHPFATNLIEHIFACCDKGDMWMNHWVAMQRAVQQPIALIIEPRLARWYGNRFCDLVLLPDTNRILPRTIAVALQRGSPYKAPFDGAIKQLQLDGTIRRLEAKYWPRLCATPMDACPTKVSN